MEKILSEEILPGGAMSSRQLIKGQALRLVDINGNANISALFLSALNPIERYNMPDTLKAQFTAFLTRGHVLFSDMGRVLCSIIEDSCGWHDTLCGCTTAEGSEKKYGKSTYQEQHNAYHHNGRDNFLIELGKYGLGKRDVSANVNFFSKVMVDEAGNLQYQPSYSKANAAVTLRAEMPTLIVLSNTPHPLNPATNYAPSAVKLQLLEVPPASADDYCRNFRPENVRGFINTEKYFP